MADVVEPGHHFEWVWLLREYEQLSGRSVGRSSDGLYGVAREHGIASEGLLYDEIATDFSVRKRSHRVWPHTEAIKAAVARHADGDEHALGFGESMAGALLDRFLDRPFAGGWIDHIGDTHAPLVDYVPASTLYHLSFAGIGGGARSLRCSRGDDERTVSDYLMNAYLDLLPAVRVAVIGDVMLDWYLHGDVSRISPEAPVPVCAPSRRRLFLAARRTSRPISPRLASR